MPRFSGESSNGSSSSWPDKHFIVATPQHVYFGPNTRHILCVGASLDAELPRLARQLGCNRTVRHEYVPHVEPKGLAKVKHRGLNMSSEACEAVKRVYRRDAELWQRWCVDPPNQIP